MSAPDNMFDLESFASRYDTQINFYQEQLQKLQEAPPPEKTPEQLATAQKELFQEVARELRKRESDLLEQEHIVQQFYNDPRYNANHWRKASWINSDKVKESAAKPDPQAVAKLADALPMQHIQGGMFTVRRDGISFDDDRASRSINLLTDSMVHVKAAWGGVPIEVNGTKEFKTISWALAEIHGVKVSNFAPEGAATMSPIEREKLARGIIAAHDEGEQKPLPPRRRRQPLPAGLAA